MHQKKIDNAPKRDPFFGPRNFFSIYLWLCLERTLSPYILLKNVSCALLSTYQQLKYLQDLDQIPKPMRLSCFSHYQTVFPPTKDKKMGQ